MKQKILTILFALLTNIAALNAEIYSGNCGDNLAWSLNTQSGVLDITGNGPMYNYTCVNHTYSPWYKHQEHIKDISLPADLTTIGDYAFYGCSNMLSISIPNNVTYIGIEAFWGCRNLSSIVIPKSVIKIGGAVLAECNELGSIVVEPGNTVYDSREHCNAIIKTESNNLIAGCRNTVIPDGVVSIGEFAFSEQLGYGIPHGLTSITIPNSVQFVRNSAFYGCANLTDVIIGSGVTTIEEGAFWLCDKLSSIVVKSGNTVYDSRDNCNAIIKTATNTLILGGNKTIIPESVVRIEDYAYCGRKNVYTINIPEGITSIGKHAFDLSDVKMVMLPTTLNEIEEYAFFQCYGLRHMSIPDSVKKIGKSAFSYSQLETLIIGSKIESIDQYAFECSTLKEITCYAQTPPSLHSKAFNTVDKSIPLYVPENSVESYKKADGWKEFSNISPCNNGRVVANGICGDKLSWELTTDGVLTVLGSGLMYDYWTSENPWLDYADKIRIISLPEGLSSIGARAFTYCHYVMNIFIPSTVTKIGYSAFKCSGLISINVAEDNLVFDSRNNCNAVIESATNTLILGCKNTIIPETVTKIGNEAFYECNNLTTLIFPESIAAIGDAAFARCSQLSSVTCHAEVVPELGKNVFNSVKCSQIPLYVPAEKVNAYKAVEQWNEFNPILAINSTFEGIENVYEFRGKSIKVLRNGQILILRGDKTYTLQGQQVK